MIMNNEEQDNREKLYKDLLKDLGISEKELEGKSFNEIYRMLKEKYIPNKDKWNKDKWVEGYNRWLEKTKYVLGSPIEKDIPHGMSYDAIKGYSWGPVKKHVEEELSENEKRAFRFVKWLHRNEGELRNRKIYE